MTALYDEFKKYSENDLYPCHMPGHKRHAFGAMSEEYASIDFTEVDSLDDLHDPEGIILESEKNTARILGADESYYLINGSTAGILAAISASVKKGGKLLMVREATSPPIMRYISGPLGPLIFSRKAQMRTGSTERRPLHRWRRHSGKIPMPRQYL